jgi:molecular chaperone GrpE
LEELAKKVAGEQTESDEVTDDGKLAELQAKLSEAQQSYLYLKADFENYKKQAIKERSKLLKYAGETVLIDLLEILDNFERALEIEVTSENIESFVDGIKMISGELRAAVERHGIKEIPAKGEKFDPTVHAALSSEPSSEIQPGYITQVFKKPYKLHDKVLRVGQVVVAKEIEENSD